MSDGFWTLRPPREQDDRSTASALDPRSRERLHRAVEAKLADGFEIESQSDRYAILVKKPRRVLGVSVTGHTVRVRITLDDRGRAAVRILSGPPNS